MEHTEITNHTLVMLVDDSSIDNFVNQKMIERYGFSENVITYTRARKALEYLFDLDSQHDILHLIPSVIFLDMVMPVIDGLRFLEEYEKLSPKIKSRCRIVILTSSVNPEDTAKCEQNKNVLAYLSKPMLKHDLEHVDQLIKQSELKYKELVFESHYYAKAI